MASPAATGYQRESSFSATSQKQLPDANNKGLHHVDSLNVEAGDVSTAPSHRAGAPVIPLITHPTCSISPCFIYRDLEQASWQRTLRLAFQSIGVIYGDIGTSPLYVYSSTFTEGIKNRDDILGVLSLIIYTVILIPIIKYVFIVLWANDHGDGGTFALYSKICRYAKVSLIPNHQPEDRSLSNYEVLEEAQSSLLGRSKLIKNKLESSTHAKIILFLCAILGTSMVIGDGVLTPSISVLSAVGGIKGLHGDSVVNISAAILVVLFCAQRFGTDKVGYTFAPAITLWFLFIAGIGVYNLITYDVSVLRAFNPRYIIDYFRRNGKTGWVSLGGVVLCITGTEAMFADLGHFNVRAIQISFTTMVFPAISLAYIGQGAYLTRFPENVSNTFYASIPKPIYWPMFVVAVVAAIIASQAMISGTFAIISQSLSLGCFPRVKVIHTSAKYEGQVYIPEINYLLMTACVVVTLAFKTTTSIGNAYGIAVVAVMLITTCMVTLIMLVIWNTSIWLIALFFGVFITIEIIYFSSVLFKFTQGGYLPLAFAAVLMTVMGIWHYVHKQRYMYELRHKVSSDYVKHLAIDANINRLPGIGLLYAELVQGIPPIFPHFVRNVPSVHSVIIFVSIKSIPISRVLPEERFLFRQVEPKEYRVFRCVVRYGYNDVIKEANEFETQLLESLKAFIRRENYNNLMTESAVAAPPPHSSALLVAEESLEQVPAVECEERVSSMQFVDRAMAEGVFYLIGEAEVVARHDSNLLRSFVINKAYSFLRKNFREAGETLAIPRDRMLRVGMTYEI